MPKIYRYRMSSQNYDWLRSEPDTFNTFFKLFIMFSSKLENSTWALKEAQAQHILAQTLNLGFNGANTVFCVVFTYNLRGFKNLILCHRRVWHCYIFELQFLILSEFLGTKMQENQYFDWKRPPIPLVNGE